MVEGSMLGKILDICHIIIVSSFRWKYCRDGWSKGWFRVAWIYLKKERHVSFWFKWNIAQSVVINVKFWLIQFSSASDVRKNFIFLLLHPKWKISYKIKARTKRNKRMQRKSSLGVGKNFISVLRKSIRWQGEISF